MTLNRKNIFRRCVSLFVLFSFILSTILPSAYAQGLSSFKLPNPGTMVSPSESFTPVLIRGMSLHPKDPLRFDFLVDSGDATLAPEDVKQESRRLVNYFLASMTIPRDNLWVNLSPYEHGRIIPDDLGKTEMGRDLLASDYILKQLAATLSYPEKETGKQFWFELYSKIRQQLGSVDIPLDLLNKVWIVPGSATVYENGSTVYIVDCKLKVMLETDYNALHGKQVAVDNPGVALGKEMVRKIILPIIEKEVNSGKNFTHLRQIYYSLILAKWYKETVKESLIKQVYVDQKKVMGINLGDNSFKEKIYEQYIKAYTKGAYNYITEEYDPFSQEATLRKYSSGGFEDDGKMQWFHVSSVGTPPRGRIFKYNIKVKPEGRDSAMVAGPIKDRSVAKIEDILANKESFLASQAGESVTKILETEDKYKKNLSELVVAKTKDEITKAEQARMALAGEMYDMGERNIRSNPVVALMAFRKVLQMQVLMKHSYGEAVLGSEYALADSTLPKLMTTQDAREYDEVYSATIGKIKDARKKYENSYQNYLAIEKGIGQVAVENILYDLGLSDDLIFWGVGEVSGRSTTYLIGMALALRQMLSSPNPAITDYMKVQAAYYLRILFTKYFHNGIAAKGIDQGGGISVPSEVYDLVRQANLDKLKEAEYLAFGTFLFDPHYGSLQGHSLTAMSWLAEIYRKMADQYYEKSVKSALDIEIKETREDLANFKNSLKGKTLEEMLKKYQENGPKINDGLRKGGGIVTHLPVRLELSAGGAQDSTFLSTARPYGYNILNLAADLASGNDPPKKSIEVVFEVRDLTNMPKKNGKNALISVKSLDIGFEVNAFSTADIAKKSKASLVYEALISLGLVPETIINKAKDERREVEVLEKILEAFAGKGKGLAITMHVQNITAGSGLAVSSMLAMGVASTFDLLTSKEQIASKLLTEENDVKRAIVTSQETVLRLAGRAGTQDEVSGRGGVMYLQAGKGKMNFPGGVVPKMMPVKLSTEAKKNLEKGLRVLRVGISEDAEDTLSQIFGNTILNRTNDQQNAWGQLTVEMLKALNAGDIVQLGRLANAAVPLREKMAPVSINPVVLSALEQIKKKYGGDYKKGNRTPGVGFSYGITGARSTGSLLLFFDPAIDKDAIDRIVKEIEVTIKEAIAAVGKLGPVEDDPHSFSAWQLSEGTKAEVKSSAEMENINKDLDGRSKTERELRIKKQRDRQLYTDAEVQEMLKDRLPDKFPAVNGEKVTTLIPGTDLSELALKVGEIDDVVKNTIRKRVEDAFRQEFKEPFNAQGVDMELHTLLKAQLAKVLTEQEAFPDFFETVLAGEDMLSMDAEFNSKVQRAIDDGKANIRNGNTKLDGISFVPQDFYEKVKKEIATLDNVIATLEHQIQLIDEKKGRITQVEYEQNQNNKSELARKKLLKDILKVMPNPEMLSYDHFIFSESETYREFFWKKFSTLQDAMNSGAIVFIPAAGGMGGRFFKGSKVKTVSPFASGNESNASYLKLLIRRWSDFLRKFPQHRQGFVQVGVSAFTKDAIKSVLDDYAKEVGLDIRNVTMGEQSLREVVWPSEAEFALQLLLESTSTDAERDELNKKYKHRFEESQNDLGTLPSGSLSSRAPYSEKRKGLNPLNQYVGIGNAGSLEMMFLDYSETYTLANLVDAGYKLNQRLISKISPDELRDGMPLAKAALLIEGNGLSVGLIQQASSRARIGGGDLAVADALEHILEDENTMFVAQYSNVAGGMDTGGVLVKDHNNNVTTLEGHRMNFMDTEILKKGYSSISTGTVFVSLKKIYKLLGYKTLEEFLLADKESIKRAVIDFFSGGKDKPENLFTIKERKEEQPGLTETWQVLQAEVALPWVLTWAQKEFGRNAVYYQEAMARVAFADDKTFGELQDGMERQEHYRATSIKTKLPQGNIEDVRIAVESWFKMGDRYIKERLYSLAAESVALARRTLSMGRNNLGVWKRIGYEKKLDEMEVKIKGGYKELLEEAGYPLTLAPDFSNRLREMLGLNLEELSNKKDVIKEEIGKIEKLLVSEVPDLLKKLREKLKRDESDPLLLIMAVDLLNGESMQDVLTKYGLDFRIEMTSRDVLEIQEIIEGLKKETAQFTEQGNLFFLVFLHREFTAIFERIIKDEVKPEGMIISDHDVTFLVDKDATIEEPGKPLKQFRAGADVDLEPDRAREIIQAAIKGSQVKILTGSTSKEIWDHVFDPISQVLSSMQLPEIIKAVVISRIEILANDGTVTARLEKGFNEGSFTLKPLTPTKKFTPGISNAEGGWTKANDLLFEKPDQGNKEIKTNRQIVWEVSMQSFLLQLFLAPKILDWFKVGKSSLTAGEIAQLVPGKIEEFIKSLKFHPDQIPNMKDSLANQRYYSLEDSIAVYFKNMLDNANESQKLNLVYKRLMEIFASDNIAKTMQKLDEEGKSRSAFSENEMLYAAFYLVHFKESYGTYGSLTGDPLDHQNQIDGERMQPLKESILSQSFWKGEKGSSSEGLKERFDKLLGGREDLKKFGEKIPAESRAGSGYLNISFGGVSKKNYIEGMLRDARTKGHVVVIMGDSVTDQGFFPYVSRVAVSKGIQQAIEVYLNTLPETWNRLRYDKESKTISFEGVMSTEERDEIINGLSADSPFRDVVTQLYNISRSVHTDRIPLRIILGSLSELNELQTQNYMEAGLVRTQHRSATVSPFSDGFRLERWGPVGFYPIMRGILKVAGRHFVLPSGDGMESRDRFLRGVIQEISGAGVTDFNIVVPGTLRKVEKETVPVPDNKVIEGYLFKSKLRFPKRQAENLSQYTVSERRAQLLAKIKRIIKEKAPKDPIDYRAKLRDNENGKRKFEVSGYLRGIDGPGAVTDLLPVQLAIRAEDVKSFDDLPRTPTVTGKYESKLTVEALSTEEKDKIIFDPGDGTSNESIGPTARDRETGIINDRSRNIANFILRDIFGISGLKVTASPTASFALAAGKESTTNTLGLIALGSILTGANLSMADILNLSVKIENEFLGTSTGGQGYLSMVLGGAYEHIWYSNDDGTWVAVSRPIMSNDQLRALEENTLLFQAGFTSTERGTLRYSLVTNNMWSDVARFGTNDDKDNFIKMRDISRDYVQALQKGDYKTVVTKEIEYVRIRDKILKIWLKAAYDGYRESNGYGTSGVLTSLQDEIRKRLSTLPAGSPYGKIMESLSSGTTEADFLNKHAYYLSEKVRELFDEAAKLGIAIVPLGAGGEGANLKVICAAGKGAAQKFLEGKEYKKILDVDADSPSFNKGVVRGFMDFKTKAEPLAFNGFKEAGFDIIPKLPDYTEGIKLSDVVEDAAMVGGVDFNQLPIERKGIGIDSQFKEQMGNAIINGAVEGFIPVLIEFAPVSDFRPFLGLALNKKRTND